MRTRTNVPSLYSPWKAVGTNVPGTYSSWKAVGTNVPGIYSSWKAFGTSVPGIYSSWRAVGTSVPGPYSSWRAVRTSVPGRYSSWRAVRTSVRISFHERKGPGTLFRSRFFATGEGKEQQPYSIHPHLPSKSNEKGSAFIKLNQKSFEWAKTRREILARGIFMTRRQVFQLIFSDEKKIFLANRVIKIIFFVKELRHNSIKLTIIIAF